MKRILAATAGTAAILSLSACADKVDESQSTNFTVAASDSECTVEGVDKGATTGTSTFNITNNGKKTTEFYVYTSGGRVVGEVENIGPGATRKLVVQLTDPGDYTLTCKPGMVCDGFSQTSALEAEVDEFVAAIDANDLAAAKKAFPISRTPYERIEPVAESFPDDLDPRIDLREADIQDGDTWTDFHKIEKQLFVDGKITEETKKDAAQLKKDVKELVDGVAAVFSHTDLYDFQANLDERKDLSKAIDVLTEKVSTVQELVPE